MVAMQLAVLWMGGHTPAWRWPLEPAPAVERPFAPGPGRYSAGHYGADLSASAGQRVLAAGAGRVTYAGQLAGRGIVVVRHGQLRTTYEPVQASVHVGQPVVGGDVLGTVTRTGHACRQGGGCLHWGLRRGEEYLDPVLLVQMGPVRLLPEAGVPAVTETGVPAVTETGVPAVTEAGVPAVTETGVPAVTETGVPAVTEAGVPAVAVRGRGERRLGRPEPGHAARVSAPSGTAPEVDRAAVPRPTPAPVTDPVWSLRAGDAPAAGLSLLALVAGLVLVRRAPHRPSAPSGAAQAIPPAWDGRSGATHSAAPGRADPAVPRPAGAGRDTSVSGPAATAARSAAVLNLHTARPRRRAS